VDAPPFGAISEETHVLRCAEPEHAGGTGVVTAKLILRNPADASIESIEVPALADTGSAFLCIPEHVRLQLKPTPALARSRSTRRAPTSRAGSSSAPP